MTTTLNKSSVQKHRQNEKNNIVIKIVYVYDAHFVSKSCNRWWLWPFTTKSHRHWLILYV